MLRLIARLVLLLVAGILLPGEAAARLQLDVRPNVAAEQKLAPGFFDSELALVRLAATLQAAQLQQAKSSDGYELAPGCTQAAESGGLRITSKGLARVEAHLDDVLANQFGDFPRATALEFQAGERGMLQRLRSGATTSFDQEFYLHELKESARFRATGNLMDAHNAALEWRGVTPASYFHPEVI